MPLVLAKRGKFVLGHHLGLLDAAVVENELLGLFHGLAVLVQADVLEVPV